MKLHKTLQRGVSAFLAVMLMLTAAVLQKGGIALGETAANGQTSADLNGTWNFWPDLAAESTVIANDNAKTASPQIALTSVPANTVLTLPNASAVTYGKITALIEIGMDAFADVDTTPLLTVSVNGNNAQSVSLEGKDVGRKLWVDLPLDPAHLQNGSNTLSLCASPEGAVWLYGNSADVLCVRIEFYNAAKATWQDIAVPGAWEGNFAIQPPQEPEVITGNTPAMGVTVNQTGGSLVDLTAYLGQTDAAIEVPLTLSQLKTGDNTFRFASNITTGGGQKDDFSVDIFYHTTADGADVTGSGIYENTGYNACTTNVPAVTLQLKNRQGEWVSVSEHTDGYIGSVICGIFGGNGAYYQSQSTLAIDDLSLYTEAKLTVLANVGSQLNVTAAAEGIIPSDSTAGMVPALRMVTNESDYTLINLRKYAGLDKTEIQIPVDVATLQAGSNTFRLGSNVTASNGQCNGTSADIYYYTTASGADVAGNGTWEEGSFSQGTTNVPAASLHLKKSDGTWETLSHYAEPVVGSVVTGLYSANGRNYQSQAAFTVADPSVYTEAYLSVVSHVGLFVAANANAETLLPEEVIPPYLRLTVNQTEAVVDLSSYAGGVKTVEIPLSFNALKEGTNVFVFDSNVTNKGMGQGNPTSLDLVLATPKSTPNTGTGYWENDTFKQFAPDEDYQVTLCLQRKDNDEWVTLSTHSGDNAGKNLLVGVFAANGASYRPQVTLSVANLSDYKAAKLQALMNVGNTLECSPLNSERPDYDKATLHTAATGDPFLRVGINSTEDWTVQSLAPYAGTISDVMIPLPVSSLTDGANQFYFHSNAINDGNRTDGSVDLMIESDTGYKNSAYSQDGLNSYVDMGEEGTRFQVCLALKRKDTGAWEELSAYSETASASLVVGKFVTNGRTYIPRITFEIEDPAYYSDAVLMARLHVGDSIQVDGTDSISYDGVGWYNRTVTLPEKQPGTEQLLHFEAIDYYAEIFINGVFIGSHEGGYAPFELSLEAAGDAVRYGADNQLTVRVTDQSSDPITGKFLIKETPAGFLQDTIAINYGGIWGNVSLITRSQVYADHLYIDTDIDKGIATVTATVYNPGDSEITVDVNALILQKETGEANGTADRSVRLQAGQSKQVSLPVTLNECTLWQLDNPHLYTAHLTVTGEGIITDTLTQTFGMRRITRDGKQLLFNGRGIFLTGWITWDVEWDTVAPMQTEEEVRKQITDLKNYGFNAIKYCLVVPPDYVLDICDEMGIYVYIEYPIWEPTESEDFFTRCYTQIPELVEKDRNHPSVILSDFACELVSYSAEMDALLQYLVNTGKEIDPNRLYTENSTVHVNKYGDFRTFHPYASLTDFDRYIDHWAASRGDYPVILGEYADARTLSKYQDIVAASGGEEPWWWDAVGAPPNTYRALQSLGFSEEQIETLQNASYASSQEAKRGYIEAAKSNPYVSGLFLTQLVDIKHNTCGFYDELGNLKYDMDELQGSAGETALLIDDAVNQKRNFEAGKATAVPPALSHFNGKDIVNGTLTYTVKDNDTTLLSGTVQENINLKSGGYYTLDPLNLILPATDTAKQYVLTFTLTCDAFTAENHWDIWSYPGDVLRSNNKTVAYYDPDALYDFSARYPWMNQWTDKSTPDAVITTKITDGIEAYLNAGGKVIYLGGGTGPVPGVSDTDGFTNFTSSSLIFFPDETHPLAQALDSNGYGGVQFIPLTSPWVQPYAADGVTGKVIYGRICHGGETYSYLSEYTVGSGLLLQCSLRLHEKATPHVVAGENPLGTYLVDQMLRYTLGDVEEAALTALTVTPPTKTEYIKGEALDPSGITAKATDANGVAYPLSTDALVLSGYDPDTVGKQTVTVTYKDLTDTFSVTVTDPLAEAQKAVADKINAIGQVTEENYQEKAQAITDAEAALQALTDTFGDGAADAIAPQVDLLTEARRLYDAFTQAAGQVHFGDVNGDGVINAQDALLVLKAAVDKYTPTAQEQKAGDVNADGILDASDALLILKKAVDKIQSFPAEA